VKRGIMEMADIILVNKADGDLKSAAMRTCADYAGALRLLRKRPQDPQGFPKAMTVSALQEDGLEKAWEEMQTLSTWRREHGHFEGRRAEQARYWFEEDVRQTLLARLQTAQARSAMADLSDQVAAGKTTPARAAELMLKKHLGA
jgi:LAO/AO transport system kinase